MDKLFNVASAIVAVAMVTTIVGHPQSANVIKAVGDAFSGSIRAALGSAR
jgi:Flp pilus assembly pilin Flp